MRIRREVDRKRIIFIYLIKKMEEKNRSVVMRRRERGCGGYRLITGDGFS